VAQVIGKKNPERLKKLLGRSGGPESSGRSG